MMPRVMAAKPASCCPGILGGEQRADVRPVRQCDGLIVAGYRDVEQFLEDPELRGEQPVHRRGRDVRLVADGFDRRPGVATFEEQRPCGLDDRGAGQASTRLAAPAAPWAALDIGSHSCEVTTLKMRVLLSKQE